MTKGCAKMDTFCLHRRHMAVKIMHASKPADTQLTRPMMMFSGDGSSPLSLPGAGALLPWEMFM